MSGLLSTLKFLYYRKSFRTMTSIYGNHGDVWLFQLSLAEKSRVLRGCLQQSQHRWAASSIKNLKLTEIVPAINIWMSRYFPSYNLSHLDTCLIQLRRCGKWEFQTIIILLLNCKIRYIWEMEKPFLCSHTFTCFAFTQKKETNMQNSFYFNMTSRKILTETIPNKTEIHLLKK